MCVRACACLNVCVILYVTATGFINNKMQRTLSWERLRMGRKKVLKNFKREVFICPKNEDTYIYMYHIWKYVRVCVCVWVCMQVCMCACMYMYVYAFLYMHACLCLCRYVCVCVTLTACACMYMCIHYHTSKMGKPSLKGVRSWNIFNLTEWNAGETTLLASLQGFFHQ